MNNIEKMNVYLSSLAVLNVKLHNLHWNVVGKQFKPLHDFTEDLYDEVFAAYDDVAERIKMLGERPYVKLSDYLANSKISEVDGKDFSDTEVLSHLRSDLETLKTLATDIRNSADEEGDFVTVALYEDFVGGFAKNLWFINSMVR